MQEEQIMKRIQKAKLFVFLRQHRHELFNEAFQHELAGLYRASERAQLALATILQVYTGVSDDEVIEVTVGSWSWIVWTPNKHRSAKEHSWLSASGLSRHTGIDGSLNEPSRLPTKARRLGHGVYEQRWIAVRCGEQVESRIPTIS